jgi:hypothetical protein
MGTFLFILIGCVALYSVMRLIFAILVKGKKAPKQPSGHPKNDLDDERKDEAVFLVETWWDGDAEEVEGSDDYEQEEGIAGDSPEDDDMEDEEEEFF